MTDRERMMMQFQTACFAVTDANLYLDTHPMDPTALEEMQKFVNLKNKLAQEFSALYGPLTVDTPTSGNQWLWANGPWPWEMEV